MAFHLAQINFGRLVAATVDARLADFVALPTVAGGKQRLEHHQAHGATEFEFWFPQGFPAPLDQETYT